MLAASASSAPERGFGGGFAGVSGFEAWHSKQSILTAA